MRFGHLATPCRVWIDHDDVDAFFDQKAGGEAGNPCGPENEYPSNLVLPDADERFGAVDVIALNHEQQVVALPDGRITVSRDGPAVSDDRGRQPVETVDLVAQGGQWRTNERRCVGRSAAYEGELGLRRTLISSETPVSGPTNATISRAADSTGSISNVDIEAFDPIAAGPGLAPVQRFVRLRGVWQCDKR